MGCIVGHGHDKDIFGVGRRGNNLQRFQLTVVVKAYE